MPPALSVAMCTWNASRYVSEQLESLAAQIRRPDELVICDDASSDDTMVHLRRFARRAPFPVRLQVNRSNLGMTRNFIRAIDLCRGDLIALSDWDDVWQDDKLQKLEAPFHDPRVGATFSDGWVVDEALRPKGPTLWQAYDFQPEDQRRVASGDAFPVLLRKSVVGSATLAFRSRDLHLAQPIYPGWDHGAWIAMMLSVSVRIAVIPERLIRARQHSANLVGAQPPGPRTSWVRELIRRGLGRRRSTGRPRSRMTGYEPVLAHLQAMPASSGRSAALRLVEGLHTHLTSRQGLSADVPRRFRTVVGELYSGRYHLYSNGFRSAAADLLTPQR